MHGNSSLFIFAVPKGDKPTLYNRPAQVDKLCKKNMKTIDDYRQIYTSIQTHNLLHIDELRNLIPDESDMNCPFAEKIHSEIMQAFRKCECADCEYSMYVNQLAVITWIGKSTCESLGEMMNFKF